MFFDFLVCKKYNPCFLSFLSMQKQLFFLVSSTHDKVFFKNVSRKSYFPLNDVIFSTFYWNICLEKNVFLETNGSWQNLFEKSTRNCMFPLGHGKKSSISMILESNMHCFPNEKVDNFSVDTLYLHFRSNSYDLW